jgi:hypothetical protein
MRLDDTGVSALANSLSLLMTMLIEIGRYAAWLAHKG